MSKVSINLISNKTNCLSPLFNQPLVMWNIKKTIIKYKILVLFILNALFITSLVNIVVCNANNKRATIISSGVVTSSITITLGPKQKFSFVSDFDAIYSFENKDDTVKDITKYFSFNQIKEFRTLIIINNVYR